MSTRIEEALAWAIELHHGQVRKGSPIPYVLHVMSVASLVAEGGGDEDQIVAALLHDAIEDAGGEATRREIERRFGAVVAALVEACTDTDVTPKPPWRERKEAFLGGLGDVPQQALLILAADKLHNARCTELDLDRHGDRMWELFRGGKEGMLWYYRSVAAALRRRLSHPYLDALDRSIDTIARQAGES